MQIHSNEARPEPVVIIGAGKTGRGFLARLLSSSDIPITFVDKDKALIRTLKQREAYRVAFFGGHRAAVQVSAFSAYASDDREAVEAIANAKIVFTSVGASRLDCAASLILTGLKRREDLIDEPLCIVTAENAVSPARKLAEAICAADGRGSSSSVRFSVTEAAIFCTTIEDNGDKLDIVSEDYNALPYDASVVGEVLRNVRGAQPERTFDKVLKRKIFTYNCASACIAYLGAFKKCACFAEAANDPQIGRVLNQLYKETGEAICREYGYSEADQAAFAASSLRKFRNTEIEDSIERNARDVVRKLLPDERLAGPALLMQKHGITSIALPLIYAAALHYRADGESELSSLLVKEGVVGILEKTSHIDASSAFGKKVVEYYQVLGRAHAVASDPLDEILKRGIA